MIVLFLLLAVLAGCGTKPTQVMVNPDTGDGKVVGTYSYGYGVAGVAAAAGAASAQQSKVDALKEAGYIEIEKVASTGIHMNVKDDLAKPVITRVQGRSPAALAGMQSEDVVVARDGIRVKNVGELKSLPRLTIGQEVEYTVLRKGKEETFKMKAVSAKQLLESK